MDPVSIIGHLSKWPKVFFDLGMNQSALSIIDLQIAISKNVKFQVLASLYSKFENITYQEFPIKTRGAFLGYNDHRKRCFDLVSNLLGKTVKNNFQNLSTYNEKSEPIITRRTIALKNWGILINLLKKPQPTTEEKFLGFSFLYMSKMEGFFEEDIRICYSWARLAENTFVDMNEIEQTKISEIQDYFRKNQMDMCIFEGWNNHLRNSIAHFSFTYDAKDNMMNFEDRYWDKQKKLHLWNERLTLNQIIEFNQRLVNVNETVTVLYAMLFIRDCCFVYHRN